MADIGVPAVVQVSPVTGTGVLPLSGSGLDQGSGAARYRSMVSVLQLAAESPALPDCTDTIVANCLVNETARGGDVRYVGVGTTAPAAIAAGDPGSALIGFGFAMWGEFAHLGSHTFPLLVLDTTGDGAGDFRVRAFRPPDTDLLEVRTSRVSDDAVVDVQPVNGFYGDVDTNAYDTDVFVLPVSLTALGIDPGAGTAPIRYAVGTDGRYVPAGASIIDAVPGVLQFDPLAPGLWVDGTTLVHDASPGTALTVHLDTDALGAPTGRLLVLDLHDGDGDRTSIVTVQPGGGGGGGGGGGSGSPPPPGDVVSCDDVPSAVFVDVTADNVHAASVDCMAFWQLATGVDDTHFAPAGIVSRGQLAAFVARLLALLGEPPPGEVPDAFGDDRGSVHEDAINLLVALGILTGTADGEVRPSATVTREQLVSILVRAVAVLRGEPLPDGPDAFTDDDGSVHEDAIDAAAAAGLVVGGIDGLFHPSNGLRRDQLATVLARVLHALGAPPP